MQTLKPRNSYRLLSVICCFGFYLVFVLIDGPVLAKDSESYISMNIAREPVYPLFLAFFRTIFGEAPGRNNAPVYLFYAAIVQALVNGYAVSRLASALETHIRRYAGILAIGFQFAVSLLNRFVAGRGSMYAESILTESLAMPVYLLFIIQLWMLYCDAASEKSIAGFPVCNLAGCAVYGFLLIDIRKQMAVALLLWGCISFFHDLLLPLVQRRRNSEKDVSLSLRRFGLTASLLLLLLAGNNLFERGYNRLVHGVFVPHTGNSMGLMSTLYYTADTGDIRLFDDSSLTEETRVLAKEILLTCHAKGITKQNLEDGTARYYIDTSGNRADEGADASSMSLGEHYASSYDVIGYEVCNPVIYAYLEENGITGIDAQIAFDDISAAICRALLRQEKGNLLQIYAVNLLRGLASSNARTSPSLLLPLSYALYALYLVLLRGLYKRTSSREMTSETDSSAIMPERFAVIVLLGLLINVAVVGLMIFPQPRYMIYSMGLFYTSLTLLVVKLAL